MIGKTGVRVPSRSRSAAELADQSGREAVAQRMALLIARTRGDGLYSASNGHTRARTRRASSRSSLHGYERPEAGTV